VDHLRELLRADAAYQLCVDAEIPHTFEVLYDDAVTGAYERLVTASSTWLESVPGVLEVFHDDLDVVLVRTSPDVTAGELEAALRRYWEQAARPATSRRRWWRRSR
jgi:hypothetical protein